jgi:6-pyruvoyltetrahydropterin/6-carboxytetrahydropterin synthase
MLITKTIEIDLGHRLPQHRSKCRNLHGHRYRIVAGVDDKLMTSGSGDGMVIDFGDLKAIMMAQIDAVYDHAVVFYKEDPMLCAVLLCSHYQDESKILMVDFMSTAENLARHWYTKLQYPLRDVGIKLRFVDVFETPTSMARYEP